MAGIVTLRSTSESLLRRPVHLCSIVLHVSSYREPYGFSEQLRSFTGPLDARLRTAVEEII